MYVLSPASVFGDISYQKLRLKNAGWNPAENVEITIINLALSKENIKENPPFDRYVIGNNRIGVYERIRRGEIVSVAFAYKGAPITSNQITIKSNRSIAQFVTNRFFENPLLNLVNKILSVVLFFLTIYFLVLKYNSYRVAKNSRKE